MTQHLRSEDIRAAQAAQPEKRSRDLADALGISEAELVAAQVGHGTTRVSAAPDDVMPLVSTLGEVMALTRNASAVHERVGTYGEYRSGEHASLVLGEEIDLRIFHRHWVYGFAVETESDWGVQRSLQFYDAAGDAVHKIYLREGSDHAAFAALVAKLASVDQSDAISVEERAPVEEAKSRPEKLDVLLAEWAKMTDTHQFMRLTAKLGMNRLGAYRIAGAPCVRAVDPGSVGGLLEAVSVAGQKVILFVGNRGNIQIHWGKLETIKPMGPWLNVLDARFNLHLRGDHVAEVWVVEKPTKRGPAISVEAFDAEGGLIFQMFGQRDGEGDDLSVWHEILAALPEREGAPA